jgi:DNA-binding MarR family transcriptional regulator
LPIYITFHIFGHEEDDGSENQAMSKSESPNGPFVDGYLPALLAQASQLISGEFHRIVTGKGMNISEWRVLASLAGAEPMSIGELARTSVTKQPTLTRVLDRMEPQGLVRRVPHKSDRRITLIEITPAGNRRVSGLIELANEHERRVLEPFGANRSLELKKTLKQMIELHKSLREDGLEDDEVDT